MNFALLWLDALLVALLWVAAGSAFVSRLRRRWIRLAAMLAIIAAPSALLASLATGAAIMKFVSKIEPNWFGYALFLLTAFLIGMLFILHRGRSRTLGSPPAAASWPRGTLAFAWIVSAAVGYMTLLNIDLAVRARCAIQSVEVNSLYLTTLPAITSEAENAASLYEQAFDRLGQGEEEEARINNSPTGNAEWEDFNPDEPATITFLTHQAATIDLLRRAGALPACRFDHDLANLEVGNMLFSLHKERNAALVLALDAREEIARGHNASAAADIAAIFRMSRHFGYRPMLISALVADGIDLSGHKVLEELLPAVSDQNDLSSLGLDQLVPMRHCFRQALRGEEKFGLAVYANMAGEGEIAEAESALSSHQAVLNNVFFRIFVLDSDSYISLMDKVQELATRPYYQIRNSLADIEAGKRKHDILTSILIPSLTNGFRPCAVADAEDTSAKVAVAMTRFRLDHGKLPTQLGELVPNYLEVIPIDPFDGQPIRLKIKGDQWMIYSVGPNGKDDAGVQDRYGRDDVPFTLKTSAKPPATRP